MTKPSILPFTCSGHYISLFSCLHSWSGVLPGTHPHKVYLPSKNTSSVQSSDGKPLSDMRMATAISSEWVIVRTHLKIPEFKHLAKPIWRGWYPPFHETLQAQ